MDAILFALQIVGCREGRLSKQSAGTQVFTSNRTNVQGHCDPRATHSYPKDHLKLPQNTILADVMAQNKRVTMFLPREPRRGTIWGAACLAKDTEIRLADGTFALIQDSVGKPIWTDQQTRLHKFDNDEADPPLVRIGGNWMTASHFIRGQNNLAPSGTVRVIFQMYKRLSRTFRRDQSTPWN